MSASSPNCPDVIKDQGAMSLGREANRLISVDPAFRTG
jgi:hypothetical protein